MTKLLFITAVIVSLALSQWSSYWVQANMSIYQSIPISDWLSLTHVRNEGGIFGLAQGKGWIFSTVAILVLSILAYHTRTRKDLPKIEYIGMGLIMGGGSSNILDRIWYGSVVDFIDLHGIPYWKYIFNTADMMIHIGIWPMLIYSLIPKNKTNIEQPES